MSSVYTLITMIAFIDLLWLFALIGIPYLLTSSLLGVYVPQAERGTPHVRQVRRSFLTLGLVSAAIGGILAFIAYALTDGSEGWALALLLIPQALGTFAAWKLARRKALALKAQHQWTVPTSSKRTAYIGADRETVGSGVSPWVYLLHAAIILVTALLIALNWHRIPNPLPVHFDIQGIPDRYSAKSIGSVYTLTIVQTLLTALFFGINIGLGRMRQNLDPADPQGSFRKQIQLRASNSWMLFLLSLIVVTFLSWMQIRSTYDFQGTLPIGSALVFLLLMLLPMIGFMVYIRRQGLEDQAINRNYNEDHYWRGGMFYVNPHDPALFVEKRTGLGWTLNFARPLGWVVTAAILVLPIAAVLTTIFLAS